MSTRANAALGLGGAILLVGWALLLRSEPPTQTNAPQQSLPSRASAPLSTARVDNPDSEIATLKAQLTDESVALQVRTAAALRLKELAGLGQPDLIGAKLDGASLDGADFYPANFTAASFRGAQLRHINFFSGTLRLADLRDADLSEADLRGAELIGANLEQANLTRAVLFGADLSDTSLNGARFRGALLKGANFTTAKVDRADWRGALYSDVDSGYPTRFPPGFDPKGHGLLECHDQSCWTPVHEPDGRTD